MSESTINRYGWHYLEHDAGAENDAPFERQYDRPDITTVAQSEEEVAASGWLVSHGFQECSARVLVNTHDGVAMLQHVGPKASDVAFGGSSAFVPQEAYTDFLVHAQKTQASVLAVPLAGDLARHQMRDDTRPLEIGVEVVELPTIKVPSGTDHTWSLAYNVDTAELVVRTYDAAAKKPLDQEYQLPRFATGDNIDSRNALAQQVGRRRELIRCLESLSYMPLSSASEIPRTAAGIMQGIDLLSEVNPGTVERIARAWTDSFIIKARSATSPDDFESGMAALELLMEATMATQQEESSYEARTRTLCKRIYRTIEKFSLDGRTAVAIGGNVLLDRLRAELKACPPEELSAIKTITRYYDLCQEEIEDMQ